MSPLPFLLSVKLTRRSTTRQQLNHLNCIAFLRPTRANVAHVKAELERPRYGSYWLCEYMRWTKALPLPSAARRKLFLFPSAARIKSRAQRALLRGGRDDRLRAQRERLWRVPSERSEQLSERVSRERSQRAKQSPQNPSSERQERLADSRS